MLAISDVCYIEVSLWLYCYTYNQIIFFKQQTGKERNLKVVNRKPTPQRRLLHPLKTSENLLRACNITKNRLQHRCFPVKFAKFLRTPIFKNTYFEEHRRTTASDFSYMGIAMKYNRWNPIKRS